MVQANTVLVILWIITLLIGIALNIWTWVLYSRNMIDNQKSKYFWFIVSATILILLSLIINGGFYFISWYQIDPNNGVDVKEAKNNLKDPNNRVDVKEAKNKKMNLGANILFLIFNLIFIGLSTYVLLDYYYFNNKTS